MSGLIVAAFAVLMLFAASMPYSRSETVQGAITTSRGVIAVMPPRTGIVTRLSIAEGMSVREGAKLAEISGEQVSASGDEVQGAAINSLKTQQEKLDQQADATRRATRDDEEAADAEIAGLKGELSGLSDQIKIQDQLVASADADIKQIADAVARGFISGRDKLAREDALLTRRQRASELRQSYVSKAGQLKQAQQRLSSARAKGEVALTEIAANRAQLDGTRVGIEVGQAALLRASIDGKVTALTAHVGDTVTPGTSIMTIVPNASSLQAEIYVPMRAIGFVKAGQSVKLMIEAYPFERFGMVEARLVSVARVPVKKADLAAPAYLAIARIADPSVRARGVKHALGPGMAVTARIVTERQSILGWLLDPLFGIIGR